MPTEFQVACPWRLRKKNACVLLSILANQFDEDELITYAAQYTFNAGNGLNIFLNTIQGNQANSHVNDQDTTSNSSAKGDACAWKSKQWADANLYPDHTFSTALSMHTHFQFIEKQIGRAEFSREQEGNICEHQIITVGIAMARGNSNMKHEFSIDAF